MPGAVGDGLGASRASMDYRAMSSEGASADRARRSNTLEESMRATAGEEAVEFYAARNPAINTAMTRFNVDMVNDGEGGFRPAANIDEVLDYGDVRRGRLSKAIKPPRTDARGREVAGERHALTIAGHAPASLLEPDGTYYHPNGRDGLPQDGQDGRKLVTLPRYRAKDPAELARYFENFLAAQAAVLPGGHDAIHGYSINMDESRPHIQILADPFEHNERGKEPDALKSGFSRAFASHRDDRMVDRVDKHGVVRRVREGGSGKMQRYHQELKERMLAAGFDIEAERDEKRHDRRLELPDFKEVEHEKQFVAEDVELVAEMRDMAVIEADAAADAHAGIDGHEAEMNERVRDGFDRANASIQASNDIRRGLNEDREKLDAEWTAERPRLVAAARDEGRKAGEAEAATLVTDARTKAEQITTAASTEAVRIRREADTEAEETKRAAKDAATQYYRDEKVKINEQLDQMFTDGRDKLTDAITDYQTKLDDDRTVHREAYAEEVRRVLEAPRPDGSPSIMERAEAQAAKNVDARYGGVGASKMPASRKELLNETREQRLARQRRQRAAALGGVNEKIAKASEQSRDSGQSAGMEGM